MFRWGNWQSFWVVVGATAGALSGISSGPRKTSTPRVACGRGMYLANMVAWLSFLVFTPPLPNAEFERIAAERAQRDAGAGGLDIIHDKPTVVASRWHGTFGAVNVSDWLLTLFAAEAIGFARVLIRHGILASRPQGVSHSRSLALVLSCRPRSGLRLAEP